MAWVLFYDGECGLCSRSIRRLAKWDRDGVIHYAPLQGDLGSRHGFERYLEGDEASMVLLDQDNGRVFTQSDSILQILRLLGGPWRLLLVFRVLPRAVRNWLYRQLAGKRHRIFGNDASACELPDEGLKSRMLD